jgi:hypothetical protein
MARVSSCGKKIKKLVSNKDKCFLKRRNCFLLRSELSWGRNIISGGGMGFLGKE